MDKLTIIIWLIAGGGLLYSLGRNREKTLLSMKMARGMMQGLLGQIISVLFLIGLLLTFLPPETVKETIAQSNVYVSTIIAALAGSITLIPAFVAFPLVGSLLEAGVDIVTAVAFLTTLTMVGIVTFPLEKREFGMRFALVRNLLSFASAVIIALIMGVVI